jgi:hypothetical protein
LALFKHLNLQYRKLAAKSCRRALSPRSCIKYSF